MKLASVTCVLNECDILELFVRINSRAIDRFWVVDNGSTDQTGAILAALKKEGFPITVWQCPMVEFHQGAMMTWAIREAMKEEPFDWVFALDADEFLITDRNRLEEQLRTVPQARCAAVRWKTYVPLSGAYHDVEAPLYHLFRPRAAESRNFTKVVIPAVMAAESVLTMGSHTVTTTQGRTIPLHTVEASLAHVPVRSAAQVISKVMIGLQTLKLKSYRFPLEGFHWDLIARLIREKHYRLSDADLRSIGLTYSQLPADLPGVIDEAGPPLGSPEDSIRYPELSQINLAERLGSFIETLCGEVVAARQTGVPVAGGQHPRPNRTPGSELRMQRASL